MIDTVVRQVDIVKVSTDDLRLLRPDSASRQAARSLLSSDRPRCSSPTDRAGRHPHRSYESSSPCAGRAGGRHDRSRRRVRRRISDLVDGSRAHAARRSQPRRAPQRYDRRDRGSGSELHGSRRHPAHRLSMVRSAWLARRDRAVTRNRMPCRVCVPPARGYKPLDNSPRSTRRRGSRVGGSWRARRAGACGSRPRAGAEREI